MTGRKLILSTTFTDTTLPVLPNVDPIETAGSLLLIEPGHPGGPWAAGVPANSATVPNLLWQRGAAAIGSGDATTLAGSIIRAGLTGSNGLVERTTKGGLHVINSLVNNSAGSGTDHAFKVDMGTVIKQHLSTYYNTHSLFISMWANVTRARVSGTTWNQYITNTLNNASFLKIVGLGTASATGALGAREANTSTTGLKIKNVARLGNTTAPTLAQVDATTFAVGNVGGINTAARGLSPSIVFYRAYLEDLTISGRTYAQVDAIDNAEYTKHVLTVGGRYYADTFTDPTTIP